MGQYCVRFAEISDTEMIMRFIDQYWKKGHILATNNELFKWQYISNNRLNMVLGIDEENRLQGILGFIPYGEEDSKDICLALWKANPGAGFLGLELLIYLMKNEPHRNVFCNGINLHTTEAIYKYFGYSVGKLNQWYRLQPNIEYAIAKVQTYYIPKVTSESTISLEEVKNFESLEACTSSKMFRDDYFPNKSKTYIEKRYFNHPVYDYKVYKLVSEDGVANSAIVFRIQECNNSRALRLIDFWGQQKDIYQITSCIDMLAKEYKAEYVDMYEYGLNEENLVAAGWIKVGSNENIIPNYFSPYAQCNVDINFCTTDDTIVMFKGDGDQDRPN